MPIWQFCLMRHFLFLSVVLSPPLPGSSSTFLCSYSSFSYICCPPFNLLFFSPSCLSHPPPALSSSVSNYSSEDPPSPQSVFLFCFVFPVLAVSPPLLLFVSQTRYLGAVKTGRLHVRRTLFVRASVGVYITPIRAHIHRLAS